MTTRQREVKRDRLYTEGDADLKHIRDKCIATIGYGSQGHAQALNLRDSGLNVIVGNREDRFAAEARADGFDVMPIVQAVKRADVILFLIPDEVQAAVYSEVEPYLREGQVLDFASGYSVHFGLIRPLPFSRCGTNSPHLSRYCTPRADSARPRSVWSLRRLSELFRQGRRHCHGPGQGNGATEIRMHRMHFRTGGGWLTCSLSPPWTGCDFPNTF